MSDLARRGHAGEAGPDGSGSRVTPLRVQGIAGVHLRARDPAVVFSANVVHPRSADQARSDFVHVFAAVAGGLSLSNEGRDDLQADVFRFLDTLAASGGGELHAILGERPQYQRRAAEEYQRAHPHIRLHFTPRGARWEEMVGVWLNLLPREATRWGTFRPVPRLVRALRDYFISGARPPFIWVSGNRGGQEPRPR